MKKWSFFGFATALLLSLSTKAYAQTHTNTQAPKYACVLERPFIFGASISSGYEEMADGIRANLVNLVGLSYRSQFNPDPTTSLSKRYFRGPFITNIAEMVNTMPNSAYGHRQLHSYLKQHQNNPQKLFDLKNATVLSSIDGFYWPAGDGQCQEAVQGANFIINLAKKNNQALILATVPEEDPQYVDMILRNIGWYPPEKECVEMINAFLKQNCKGEDQCYLIDIHETVRALNNEGIQFENRTVKSFDLRSDGVHLTKTGVRYIMSLIEKALEENPPACAK